jgi:hypothetical protein
LPQYLPSSLEPLTLYQHLAAAPPNIRICPLRVRTLLGVSAWLPPGADAHDDD